VTTRQYFGTDGIRGTANTPPMTAEIALKVGMAAGHMFNRGDHRHRVVIAKDTRLSGYMIENALTAGFLSVGMDVLLFGPLPTPAVAFLTRAMRADLGVMISASHNAFADNGLKLFGPDGYKLSDAIELEIERAMHEDMQPYMASPKKIGRAKRIDDAPGRYIELVKSTFPKHLRLDGLKIVVDCAHGAGYIVGPIILWELGAEVISIGTSPNGFNINSDCGSTHPQALAARVVEEGADLGIALDGDADRLIMVDEKGRIIEGDQLMAMIATHRHRTDTLEGGGVVSTVMANLGLETYLRSLGITLHRSKVGDRYVMEIMRQTGCTIGGEPSGHMIFSHYSTTGDALVAALQAIAVLLESGKRMSDISQCFTPAPQQMKNVYYRGKNPLHAPEVIAAIAAAETALNTTGRVVVRASGTEPLIRVMAEGEDAVHIEHQIDSIVAAINAVTARDLV
jgi:phosphoglucosamine mutase